MTEYFRPAASSYSRPRQYGGYERMRGDDRGPGVSRKFTQSERTSLRNMVAEMG